MSFANHLWTIQIVHSGQTDRPEHGATQDARRELRALGALGGSFRTALAAWVAPGRRHEFGGLGRSWGGPTCWVRARSGRDRLPAGRGRDPQIPGRCLCPVRLVRFLEVKNERGVQKPGGVSGSDF